MFTEQLAQRQAIAFAPPQTINSGGTATINTGSGINMGIARRARCILNVGAVTGGGAVTLKLRASASYGGTFSDIGGAATITGINTANQPNSIEIRCDQMPSGKPWLRAEATETGGQNVVVNLELIADEGAYKPLSQLESAPNPQGGSSAMTTWTNNVVF